jgi:hypothetical protein
MPGPVPGIFNWIAFSSEVSTGSREESASNLEVKDRDNSGL